MDDWSSVFHMTSLYRNPRFDIRAPSCSLSISLKMKIIMPSDNFISSFFFFLSSVFCRTCVNGTMIDSLVHLWHGDRILWGNNHFFRYKACPSVDTVKCVVK